VKQTPSGLEESSSTQRLDQNGRFQEVERQFTGRNATGNQVEENAVHYTLGPTGSLELNTQTVTRIVKHPDGSEIRESDVYGAYLAGRVSDSGSPQAVLRERQLVERKPGPGGVVVETLSVSRPAVSEPGRFTPFERISERVCTGHCAPPKN
jgi:hypothetical protein